MNQSTDCLLFRLLMQIEETESTLDKFWQKHEAHLRLCLQLRQFELDFRELQVCDKSRRRYRLFITQSMTSGQPGSRYQRRLADGH